MFALKKIIGHLLMPFPLGLGLIALGLLFLLLRRRLGGWLFLILGCLILATAGNRAVSIAFTSSLEKTYPPAPALGIPAGTSPPSPDSTEVENTPASPSPSVPATPNPAGTPSTLPSEADLPAGLRGIAFVAVLGGGHGDAALPAGQRLSPSARARLIEGLRIALALPDSWLVVCGPRINPYNPRPDDDTHARVLADSAVELGFPRDRIVELDTARDTAGEIDAIKLLAGDERVALVTSAWHLPRAMRFAASAELDAFPCPSDYLGGRDDEVGALAWFTWDSDSLMNTTRAWREYIGLVWARFVSRKKAPPLSESAPAVETVTET